MNDERLERMLRRFDFSLLSQVREPLRKELLDRMEWDQHGMPWQMTEKLLSDENLDEVAAAGAFPSKPKGEG